MNLLGAHTPGAIFDWSGSILVVISLVYLFRKSPAYWHFSNASLLPYFVLWASSGQFMLAGLQVSYLVFGLYGLSLWHLERRRRQGGVGFHERFWYNLGWVLSLAIFLDTIVITRFTDGWAWLQFLIVALSLLANWATTRLWLWSWPVWMAVNALQAVYFAHFGLWAQFGLQFVLCGMSIVGWREWRRAATGERIGDVSTV